MPEFYVFTKEAIIQKRMSLVRADDEEQARAGKGTELIRFPVVLTTPLSKEIFDVLPFEETE